MLELQIQLVEVRQGDRLLLGEPLEVHPGSVAHEIGLAVGPAVVGLHPVGPGEAGFPAGSGHVDIAVVGSDVDAVRTPKPVVLEREGQGADLALEGQRAGSRIAPEHGHGVILAPHHVDMFAIAADGHIGCAAQSGHGGDRVGRLLAAQRPGFDEDQATIVFTAGDVLAAEDGHCVRIGRGNIEVPLVGTERHGTPAAEAGNCQAAVVAIVDPLGFDFELRQGAEARARHDVALEHHDGCRNCIFTVTGDTGTQGVDVPAVRAAEHGAGIGQGLAQAQVEVVDQVARNRRRGVAGPDHLGKLRTEQVADRHRHPVWAIVGQCDLELDFLTGNHARSGQDFLRDIEIGGSQKACGCALNVVDRIGLGDLGRRGHRSRVFHLGRLLVEDRHAHQELGARLRRQGQVLVQRTRLSDQVGGLAGSRFESATTFGQRGLTAVDD